MKRKLKRTFYDSWTAEEEACMDYLHGSVPEAVLEAALMYECARESAVLREVAAVRNKLLRDKARSPRKKELYLETCERAARAVGQKHNCDEWFYTQWEDFWRCQSFPGKPWHQLKPEEQAQLVNVFPTLKVQSAPITNLAELDEMGIMDELHTAARQEEERFTKSLNESGRVPPPSFPILNKNERTFVLLTIDFRENKTQAIRRFRAFLDRPENQKRFAKFHSNPTGTTGTAKDRLKNLAVWRLHEELGFVGMVKLTESKRRREPNGQPMPFHDARAGQSKQVPLNQAPLCSEESFCLKAAARARKHIKAIGLP